MCVCVCLPEASILGGGSSRDDLCNKDGGVVSDVRIISSSCDTEAQTRVTLNTRRVQGLWVENLSSRIFKATKRSYSMSDPQGIKHQALWKGFFKKGSTVCFIMDWRTLLIADLSRIIVDCFYQGSSKLKKVLKSMGSLKVHEAFMVCKVSRY